MPRSRLFACVGSLVVVGGVDEGHRRGYCNNRVIAGVVYLVDLRQGVAGMLLRYPRSPRMRKGSFWFTPSRKSSFPIRSPEFNTCCREHRIPCHVPGLPSKHNERKSSSELWPLWLSPPTHIHRKSSNTKIHGLVLLKDHSMCRSGSRLHRWKNI